MLQIMQHIGWAFFQSCFWFAAMYISWLVFFSLSKNKIAAKYTFGFLFLFIIIGLVYFVVQLFTFKQNSSNGFYFGIVSNKFAYYCISALGIIYSLIAASKLLNYTSSYFKRKEKNLELLVHNDLLNYIKLLSEKYKISIPKIFTSSSSKVAYTKGFFRKIIVLPICIINQLTEEELETVLLHELAHIVRYDHYTNCIIIVAEIVLSANPFAMHLMKQLKLQRELACDDFVLQQQVQPKHYANALHKAASLNASNNLPLLAMQVPQYELLYRVKRLFNKNVKPTSKHSGFVMLSFGVLIALLFSNPNNSTNTVQKSITPFEVAVEYNPLQKVANQKEENIVHKLPKIEQKIVSSIKKPLSLIVTLPQPNGVDNKITEEPLIKVSNTNENIAYQTEITSTLSKVGNIVFQLKDSIVIFDKNVTKENITTVTSEQLSKVLEIVAAINNNNTPTNNLIIPTVVTPISVTQGGTLNAFYSNAAVSQKALYNEKENSWTIFFAIENQKKLATRVIQLVLQKTLQSIKL